MYRASKPGILACASMMLIGATSAPFYSEKVVTPAQRHHQSGSIPLQDERMREQLEVFFAQQAAEGFSGEIFLTREGRTVFHRTYGVSGCGAEAIRPGAVYLIGSLVKDYTKLAAYILDGRGDLSLDSPVTDYLDGLPDSFRRITVRMLVEHTAGLPDVIGAGSEPQEYTTDWDYERVNREEMLRRAANVSLQSVPGTEEHYSNLGYTLLAMVIENASGQRYEEFVREQVLLPLGMTDTGYVLADTHGDQLIDGCLSGRDWAMPTAGGKWLSDGPSWNVRGNGGMLGTVGDIAKWLDVFSQESSIGGASRGDYLSATIGMSRSFGSRAVAAGGSNGVYNAYYLRLFEPNMNLIMISNNSEHWVELYKDDLFAMLRPYVAAEE